MVIGRNIDAVTISYRPVDDPESEWKDRWSGPSGAVLVWIQVRVVDQTVERFIVPQVNANIIDG